MRSLIAAFALALAAACTPPAAEPAAEPAPAPAADETTAEAPDFGPYANNWNSAEFSRFRHTLNAASPGAHEVTLAASTTSPGGETVAVYPIGPDGAPLTARLTFVIATTAGGSETRSIEIPAEGLPVEVVVENAAGRSFAGHYTLTIGDPSAP